ncbi:MAG: Crp/Fnr family transcriptional regulator [Saprospiraceae bacterium]|nr:Crp/Fnr family transcriptional regulator [Saprospiraceae bacterium]
MALTSTPPQCYDILKEKFQYLLEDELIREICQSGKLNRFRPDMVIMDIGEKIDAMPIIVSGSIKVMTEDEDGNELLLYYLELGDTCAMTLTCCSKASKSSVRAIADDYAEILFVPVEKLDEWMVKYKSWRNFILDNYNMRLNEMLSAIDNLAFHNMEERLFLYLQEKAAITRSKDIKISHYQIANDLNSSRVVISRLMKKLEDDGKVKQGRNMVEFFG